MRVLARRLAPRRRHFSVRFSYPPRIEGSSLHQPLWDLDLMTSGKFEIRHESDGDAPVLSQLAAEAFGPAALPAAPTGCARASRLSPGSHCAACSTDAWSAASVSPRSGSATGRAALLLGPLIVDPAVAGKGIGKALVEEGLARARGEGFSLVLLVGDMPYYGRFGFKPVPPGQITLPGPVDPARLLYVELVPGAIEAQPVRSKAMRVSGLRGTRSRPETRGEDRARASRRRAGTGARP